MKEIDVTKGFKAYEPGLVCLGKQYAENTTFEEDGGSLCGSGMMHYCANPLDCLDYYPLINDNCELNDFTDVTAEEKPVGDGKKYATKRLHVGVKLNLKGFIKAAFDFLWESSEHDSLTASAKRNAQLAASGDSAKLAASGYAAQLAASGDFAQLAASGDFAKLAASGDFAQLAASGYAAKLAASGEDSIVAGIGRDNIGKAARGCWLVLAEWAYSEEKEHYVPACVKAAQIDGVTLKPDTWYQLKNGEFAEVEE